MACYAPDWDLQTIPDELLAGELHRRKADLRRRAKALDPAAKGKRGRPPQYYRCPTCQETMTARAFRVHRCPAKTADAGG